ADRNRGTCVLSNARLRAYGRGLELETRALTSFGAPRSSDRRKRKATSQRWSPGPPVRPVEVVPNVTGGDNEPHHARPVQPELPAHAGHRRVASSTENLGLELVREPRPRPRPRHLLDAHAAVPAPNSSHRRP